MLSDVCAIGNTDEEKKQEIRIKDNRGHLRETPNNADGGSGLKTEAYLLTAACLEDV